MINKRGVPNKRWGESAAGKKSKKLTSGRERLRMVGRQRNIHILDQLEHSLFQWFYALKSLYFKVYFLFTWHLESPYTDLLQLNSNLHIYLLPIWKINNIPGKSSHSKTWLLIHSVQKLWTSVFYRQTPIWSSPFFIFF